jgi:hypothetical protein
MAAGCFAPPQPAASAPPWPLVLPRARRSIVRIRSVILYASTALERNTPIPARPKRPKPQSASVEGSGTEVIALSFTAVGIDEKTVRCEPPSPRRFWDLWACLAPALERYHAAIGLRIAAANDGG